MLPIQEIACSRDCSDGEGVAVGAALSRTPAFLASSLGPALVGAAISSVEDSSEPPFLLVYSALPLLLPLFAKGRSVKRNSVGDQLPLDATDDARTAD